MFATVLDQTRETMQRRGAHLAVAAGVSAGFGLLVAAVVGLGILPMLVAHTSSTRASLGFGAVALFLTTSLATTIGFLVQMRVARGTDPLVAAVDVVRRGWRGPAMVVVPALPLLVAAHGSPDLVPLAFAPWGAAQMLAAIALGMQAREPGSWGVHSAARALGSTPARQVPWLIAGGIAWACLIGIAWVPVLGLVISAGLGIPLSAAWNTVLDELHPPVDEPERQQERAAPSPVPRRSAGPRQLLASGIVMQPDRTVAEWVAVHSPGILQVSIAWNAITPPQLFVGTQDGAWLETPQPAASPHRIDVPVQPGWYYVHVAATAPDTHVQLQAWEIASSAA